MRDEVIYIAVSLATGQIKVDSDIFDEVNYQPPANDYDEPPKRGKKGKYLKDWQ